MIEKLSFAHDVMRQGKRGKKRKSLQIIAESNEW